MSVLSRIKSVFGSRKKPVQTGSNGGLSRRDRLVSNRERIINYANSLFGSSESGGGKYRYGISGDGTSLIINIKRMILNSRKAYRDSLECKSIVDRNTDIVVDTGIKISPTCNASILGLTEEQADEWNDNVAERFDLYFGSKKCHRARLRTGYDMQRLYNKTGIIDGDNYVRFFFEKERDALSTLSFDFVDAMNIAGDGKVATDGTLYPHDGIKRDHRGREIEYNIRRMLPNGKYEYVKVPKEKFGRVFMSHGFEAEQVNQLKGYPKFGSILQEFQNIADFTLSHVDKAIAQASFAFAVTNDGENDPSNPLADVSTPAARKVLETLKDAALTEEEVAAVESMNLDKIDQFVSQDRGSAAILNLKSKDKIQMLENKAPVTGYDKFVESFTSHLAAAAGMPVEVLLMKFGSNYSASRAALILFYRIAEIFRKKMDSDFLTPTYENWLSEEIAAGRIFCPGFSDPILRAAWTSHGLVAAPVPNIDPYNTAKANELNLKMSATTLDRVSQETNGSNGKANRSANNRQFNDLPLTPWDILEHDDDEIDENNQGDD